MFSRLIVIVVLSFTNSLVLSGTTLPQLDDRSGPGLKADLKPVTLKVVEKETGEPITNFAFRFWYKAPGVSRPYNKEWQTVESRSGTVVIQAPRACRLTVDVEWKHMRAKVDDYREFIIQSNDRAREVIVKLERGATVHGLVRDADTKQPIAGAIVSPMARGVPFPEPRQEQKTITDKGGRFELHGVDLLKGVWTVHPEYRSELTPIGPEAASLEVLLKKERTKILKGTVHDTSHKPLQGVTISDGEQRVQTAYDGTFTLTRYSSNSLKFAKEGYISRDLIFSRKTIKDGIVKLERQISLRGRVLSPDERPVENFEILAGPGTSEKHHVYVPSVKKSVNNREGQFSLGLDWHGSTWIGIRAPGFARGELLTDVPPSGLTQDVRLQTGVSITGKFLAPSAGLAQIKARLVPRRNQDDGRGLSSTWEMKEWATLSTTLTADGTVRFDNVRPGGYTLDVSGPSITPFRLAIDVPATGLDCGHVRVAGRGRITGRVFRSEEFGGSLWRFAEGRVRVPGRPHEEEVDILSDEDGRFSVDGVPVGLVMVGFPYMTFDVQRADEWTVQVLENQTTEIELLDPDNRRALPVKIRIGDDSLAHFKSGTGLGAQRQVIGVTSEWTFGEQNKDEPLSPRFRIDLIPRSRLPLSFVDPAWHELDFNKHVVLSDVSPGNYRLRVLDWLGSRDFDEGVLFEQDITMPSDALPLKVSLGAGSITGRILGASDGLKLAEVIAAPDRATGGIRRARCDSHGAFCVRYLDPGNYTLFVHDLKNGWVRIENVAVAANVTDVGERRLVPGGAIHGLISFKQPSPVPDAIVATGPSSVSLRIPFESYSSFDDFELTGLWPGHWSIAVHSGDQILATATAELIRTEKVKVAIAVGNDRRP